MVLLYLMGVNLLMNMICMVFMEEMFVMKISNFIFELYLGFIISICKENNKFEFILFLVKIIFYIKSGIMVILMMVVVILIIYFL